MKKILTCLSLVLAVNSTLLTTAHASEKKTTFAPTCQGLYHAAARKIYPIDRGEGEALAGLIVLGTIAGGVVLTTSLAIPVAPVAFVVVPPIAMSARKGTAMRMDFFSRMIAAAHAMNRELKTQGHTNVSALIPDDLIFIAENIGSKKTKFNKLFKEVQNIKPDVTPAEILQAIGLADADRALCPDAPEDIKYGEVRAKMIGVRTYKDFADVIAPYL